MIELNASFGRALSFPGGVRLRSQSIVSSGCSAPTTKPLSTTTNANTSGIRFR
jgi:hypothetical protein